MLGNAKGKGKVMSYEDLVEARAKRVIKEATRAAKGKGKRGRKVVSRKQHVTRSVLPIGNDVVMFA